MIQIKLERIGDNIDAQFDLYRGILDEAIMPGFGDAIIGKGKRCKAWCAEIIGFNEMYIFERRFLKPARDYTNANSIGSRGVYDFFNLEEGHIYDISQPVSWGRTGRYFCRIEHNKIVRGTKEDVKEWLNDRLGLTS